MGLEIITLSEAVQAEKSQFSIDYSHVWDLSHDGKRMYSQDRNRLTNSKQACGCRGKEGEGINEQSGVAETLLTRQYRTR